ncbi:MAG: helix-hairpin-helix domain-containing protein [Rhizomicrobium sp.]
MAKKTKDELMALANVGPATREDFRRLGINCVAELAAAEADELYTRLCTLTGTRQDPCVHDVFTAAIHQARTGEATKWWQWSKVRKQP